MTPAELHHAAATRVGDAVVHLVDQWVAVSTTGELLVRDVWRARLETADLTVDARVLTLPEPSAAALATAVEAELAALV